MGGQTMPKKKKICWSKKVETKISSLTLNKVADIGVWGERWLLGSRPKKCSGTNFIKTLELNELVNHIAQLGCCPKMDRECGLACAPLPFHVSPESRLPTPGCPGFIQRLYLFLLQCGLKNNFRKQKCNERRNEL